MRYFIRGDTGTVILYADFNLRACLPDDYINLTIRMFQGVIEQNQHDLLEGIALAQSGCVGRDVQINLPILVQLMRLADGFFQHGLDLKRFFCQTSDCIRAGKQ